MTVTPFLESCRRSGAAAGKDADNPASPTTGEDSYLIVPKGAGLRITGTFLDEISHDIPHQNRGPVEWDRDFLNMKAIGIDTVIMIRSGYRKFITFEFSHFMSPQSAYMQAGYLYDRYKDYFNIL